MRKCKFNFGQTKWQDGIFHRWYETGGDNNTLVAVLEDSTGLIHNLIASTVQIRFVEPSKETMVTLQVPNKLKDAFVGLLEVMLSAHLYNPLNEPLELDEVQVLDIIETLVTRELAG